MANEGGACETFMVRRHDWAPTLGPKLNDRHRAHLAAAVHNRKHSIRFAINRDLFAGSADYETREPLKQAHVWAAERIAKNRGLSFLGVAIYRLNSAVRS